VDKGGESQVAIVLESRVSIVVDEGLEVEGGDWRDEDDVGGWEDVYGGGRNGMSLPRRE
jgi:hypothetical protein